jgi:hypothetical protein
VNVGELGQGGAASAAVTTLGRRRASLPLAARPLGGVEMPTFRLEDQQGRWLTNMRSAAPNWQLGDKIPRGHDMLEVVEVRYDQEPVTLVVKGHGPECV